MDPFYITLTGLNHYYGMKPFALGRIVRLVKEPDNAHDGEAICAELPYIGTVGYVANSVQTVYGGTDSAGRIYDRFSDHAYAQVMFITHAAVIARFLRAEEVEETGTPGTPAPPVTPDPPAAPGQTPMGKIGF